MKAPQYRNEQIASIDSLSRCLAISKASLTRVIANSEQFYSLPNVPIIKPDGTIREIYRVENPLKKIQKQILNQIFHHVDYPDYLQGSITGQEAPRDYISNAKIHTHKRVLIHEDISNFFSSIKARHVKSMWKYLFRFSDEVATALTKLTTFGDVVPQGASTSSYIGNLIFWDKEPLLEYALRKRGFYYSRYVDDIAISTNRGVNHKEIAWVRSEVYTMLYSKGVKPNRRKSAVQTNSKRMTVHKLVVNSEHLTLGRKKLSQLRSEVKRLEQTAQLHPNTILYQSQFASVYGKAIAMSRVQPQKIRPYLQRLELIKPVNGS